MPMDRDDERYFDAKFGEVHKRISDSKEELTTMITGAKDHARELVEKHEEKKHNPAKTIGLLAGLTALVAGACELLKGLFSKTQQG